MRFATQTVWFERRRYLAGVLAVAVSNVLIGLQVGIMIGLVGMVSIPIDLSSAHIWLTSPNTPSCDLGLPISKEWRNRLEMRPEIQAVDECIQSFSFWNNPAKGNVLVILLGINLSENS